MRAGAAGNESAAAKEKKKKSSTAGLIKTANPNAANVDHRRPVVLHAPSPPLQAQNKHVKASELGKDGAPKVELTRREREEIEKQRAAAAFVCGAEASLGSRARGSRSRGPWRRGLPRYRGLPLAPGRHAGAPRDGRRHHRLALWQARPGPALHPAPRTTPLNNRIFSRVELNGIAKNNNPQL